MQAERDEPHSPKSSKCVRIIQIVKRCRRRRALADKVAASITPTQTDTAPAPTETDKDREIAELKKQIAQLKALASSQQESE
jgi:hypothetical protein